MRELTGREQEGTGRGTGGRLPRLGVGGAGGDHTAVVRIPFERRLRSVRVVVYK